MEHASLNVSFPVELEWWCRNYLYCIIFYLWFSYLPDTCSIIQTYITVPQPRLENPVKNTPKLMICKILSHILFATLKSKLEFQMIKFPLRCHFIRLVFRAYNKKITLKIICLKIILYFSKLNILSLQKFYEPYETYKQQK